MMHMFWYDVLDFIYQPAEYQLMVVKIGSLRIVFNIFKNIITLSRLPYILVLHSPLSIPFLLLSLILSTYSFLHSSFYTFFSPLYILIPHHSSLFSPFPLSIALSPLYSLHVFPHSSFFTLFTLIFTRQSLLSLLFSRHSLLSLLFYFPLYIYSPLFICFVKVFVTSLSYFYLTVDNNVQC